MPKYTRIKGGEKNALSGIPFSKDELEKVCELYVEMGGKGIHERNPKIHKLAIELNRTVRSVENQLLGFRLVDSGKTGRANFNKLIKDIWSVRLRNQLLKRRPLLVGKQLAKKNFDPDFRFKISSHLKNIIGKELITDDYIAVFELVKNSFDAHSNYVKIIFEEDSIIIWDNGKGMDKEDIINKWLFVAYSAKKEGKEDEEFRVTTTYRDKISPKQSFAGAKGIGRFSSDRLGQNLSLTTRKITKSSLYWTLKFNWDDFEEDAEEEFSNINVDHESSEESKFEDFDHGVILEISNLRSIWPREKILSLKWSLEKLINPFSSIDKKVGSKNFDIEIISNRDKKNDELIKQSETYNQRDLVNGPVKNFIFETLNIKTTQINVEIFGESLITTLYDRGNLIYKIEEPNGFHYIPEGSGIQLYYLNFAAKINFTQLMGIRAKNFGSIFLFNNGFRVFPIGEPDNDPFEVDRRKAQGHSRFLGTRELIGSVEIWGQSENFQEASSRDGGLINSPGTVQLEEWFYETLKRLERYVQPILWQIKKRTGSGNEELDFNAKADVINLIARLVDNKNIKLLDYSKDFINILDEKTADSAPDIFDNLKRIAQDTKDDNFINQIDESELEYIKLKRERDEQIRKRYEAEERALEEERQRKKAQENEKIEIEKRIKAEEKAKKEEERRVLAELSTKRKENERLQEELQKIKALQKAKEEEEARKKAENIAEKRKQQINRIRSSETIEYKDLRDSNHIISVYSDDITKKILLLKRKLDKKENLEKSEIINILQGISMANEKISTITRFTTKANFLKASLSTTEDIVLYIKNYLEEIYNVLYKDIDIEVTTNNSIFIKEFQPIELCVVIDNILSNSRKKHAKKIFFNFKNTDRGLELSIKDIGKPLDDKIDKALIFEEGITSSNGSGLGLSHVKRILENDLNASVSYIAEYSIGFELRINFNK
jgi:signal transduction histidine kinase